MHKIVHVPFTIKPFHRSMAKDLYDENEGFDLDKLAITELYLFENKFTDVRIDKLGITLKDGSLLPKINWKDNESSSD